jgi:hypothetical protein
MHQLNAKVKVVTARNKKAAAAAIARIRRATFQE